MNPDKASELAQRYVEVWHETDPVARRAAIEALWAPGGEHYVRTIAVRGYDELEQRVTGSHEKNVRDGGYRFRVAGDPQELHDAVTFHWEMLPAAGGEIESTGFVFLLLDADGRILCDYQFIVS